MTSGTTLHDLDLIDLLNERHYYMQSLTQQAWNDKSDVHISNTEWFIMAQIYETELPVSHITKNLDISRQAIHKLINNLSEKGLIEVYKMENNKKERCITLTDFGRQCYDAKASIKSQIEDIIATNLGEEQMITLKNILQADWGV